MSEEISQSTDQADDVVTINGRFWIDRGSRIFLGAGRIELLEQIEAGKSIAEAARQLGMGYKTAWDMLNDMNAQSDEPLVIRTKGGRHGGGTTLTEYGKQTIALFNRINKEYQTMLCALEQRYPILAQWQNLDHHLMLKTSARNQLFCTIHALEKKGHNILVTLHLGEKQFIQAQLTQTSVDELKLSIGQQIIALIKAPLISISMEKESTHLSLEGSLESIEQDDEGAEVSIVLKSGQTLIATVKAEQTLPELGALVYPMIDPTQVILAVL